MPRPNLVLLLLNVLGGIAVLGSYVAAFTGSPDFKDGLWGGVPESLRSASHGAGRAMSRTGARESFRWSHADEALRHARVRVISAGLDEVPMAYKDIHAVMAAQADLVDVVARFDPRLVKMAPDGERAED